MMQSRLALACAACLAAAPLPAAAAAAAEEVSRFLTPMGPIAELQRVELIWAAALILIAVMPVFVGVPLILWHYRRSNRQARYAPAWSFDTKLEIAMWLIPTIIIIAISIWLTQATFRIDPYREIDAEMAEGMEFAIDGPPVVVDVVGLDWKWLYLYPEAGVASVGELVVPVGRPVRMRLTTDTVMQSYMAAGLAGQIYAMPGMVTKLNFLADRPGTAEAQNTQYNGEGFARQRAPVRALGDAEYAAWLDRARAEPPLDDRAYARLAQSGDLDHARETFDRGPGPVFFSLPDDRLFGRIVARYTNGDAVPLESQPGSPSYDPETATLPDEPSTMMHGLHAPVAVPSVEMEDAE